MSRTITAMFTTRADAEAGAERLRQAGVHADHIHVHDQSTHQTTGAYSSQNDQGAWSKIKNAFIPDEDRHTYDEGMRRGNAVLTADVGDHEADAAVRALEESNSIDVDDAAGQWRNEGWDYAGGAAAGGTAGAAAGLFGSRDTDAGLATDRATGANEEVIPVVEEQLVVGKRDVQSGGVRVRSYVTETPVHEQVRLREEHVNVARRAVDQPVDSLTGDAFRERTIDMTATSEEAVVGKTARVVEEVVVSKTAGERTEDVSDTVRRTDVEVEDDTTTTRTGLDRDGMSGKSDRDKY